MDAVEFQQLAAGSRTYRRYGARPLRRDELLGLVEAARLAPTGNNSQQLRFRVVPGMEDPAGCQLVFSHLHWAASLPDWDGPEADERPGGYVVVCLPHKVAKSPVRLIDVGIAAQTLALAAAARGLGACMHKSYDACLGSELGLEGLGRAGARRRGRCPGPWPDLLARPRPLPPRAQTLPRGASRLG